MKIILPDLSEVEVPDSFSHIAYTSDDMFYEIAFFRKDVIPYVQYFAYFDNEMRPYRNYSKKQDWCYDIIDMENLKEGTYQICFTFDYEDNEYTKSEYEIRHTSDN